MVEFDCPECHASAPAAQRALLCFACRANIARPASGLDPAKAMRVLARQAMADDDEDGDDEKEDEKDDDTSAEKKKPQKAKGGMSVGMILGIVAVLLLCCVCTPLGAGLGFVFLGSGLTGASQTTQTMNNMKNIGLAAHGYHDFRKVLPSPRSERADLSWRVELLPFIEQDNMFRQFDVTKNWDQPPNQQFLSKRPNMYQSALHPAKDPTQTPFQYFTGPNTLFPQNNSKVKLIEIKDAASHTILFAESTAPVPWSKQADMTVGGALSVPTDRYLICMGDATVKTLNPPRISDPDLRGMINPNDGKLLAPGLQL